MVLKALFCCQVVAFVLRKTNYFWGGIIGVAFFYFFNRWQLNIMFPAFFLGMILRKYDIWWKEKVIFLLFISLFIYVISIVIRHNYADISHIMRMITGLLVPLCGSLFIISLFYAMRNYIKNGRLTNTFAYWGTKTKELYILHMLLFEFGLMYVWKYIHFNSILFNLFWGPLLAVSLMWIIVRMNELLQKNGIVNALLLGHFK